jgi:small subunit ribosomal protein S21
MLKVRVEWDDLKGAMRKLKKIIEKDGIVKEMKKHEYYEKPSQTRRRKALQRLKTIYKAQQESRENTKHNVV